MKNAGISSSGFSVLLQPRAQNITLRGVFFTEENFGINHIDFFTNGAALSYFT